MERPLHFVFRSFQQKCSGIFRAKSSPDPLDKSGKQSMRFHRVISVFIYTFFSYIITL